MGVVRQVLFGKVDLDTIATSFVLGLSPWQDAFRCVKGSASSADLADKATVCIEVGGSGRTSENNFDHHATVPAERSKNLSACAQALRCLANVIDYVDRLDRGLLTGNETVGFPSLSQLVSGMLLSERNPVEQMKQGNLIFGAVVQLGLDPFTDSVESILDAVPQAREWAKAKRKHMAKGQDVLERVLWLETGQGRKLAVVESDWFGTPGLLYGHGADIVVSLNPAMPFGGETYRKFTVGASRSTGVLVNVILDEMNSFEKGWGGPSHGTIIGSIQGADTSLTLEQVTQVVVDNL